MYSSVKSHFHFDINLNYQEITGVKDIRFRSNPEKQLYKRTIWGLKQSGQKSSVVKPDVNEQKSLIDEIQNSIGETSIDRAVVSPDQNYIVYREIESNYFHLNQSYDQYCYYRGFDRQTGDIQTIYEGYQEWFDLEWK